MKRRIRVPICILAVAAGLDLFHVGYSRYLDSRINEMFLHHTTVVDHAQGVPEKDEGDILLRKSLETSNLVLMGSSELSGQVEENPKNLFPNDLYKGDVTLIGHAGFQNALHAINLGANGDCMNGKDIAIIESLQWFMDEDTEPNAFFSNFSELHFYEFLTNDRISEENKLYACRRYMQMEAKSFSDMYNEVDGHLIHDDPVSRSVGKFFGIIKASGYEMKGGTLFFPQTYALASLYASDDLLSRIAYYITGPYFAMRHKVLQLKDMHDSYTWLLSNADDEEGEHITARHIDWNELEEKGRSDGEMSCTNNDMFISDVYYSEYLSDKINDLKGSQDDVDLMETGEWDDLEFFMKVCKDLGLRPYVVAMSTNGLYYDYIGIDKDERDRFYDRIVTVADKYGYKSLNTADKEYEPYFYYDMMHLGWRGWPYVTEKIIDSFAK